MNKLAKILLGGFLFVGGVFSADYVKEIVQSSETIAQEEVPIETAELRRRYCLYDLNQDGVITQGDADLLTEYIDTVDFFPVEYDVNLDGFITIEDQNIVTGKIGKDCISACVYDIDLNGEVTSSDINLLDMYFGKDYYPLNFDVNRDGVFNSTDIQRVTWRVGKGCNWNCIYDIDRDMNISDSDLDVLRFYKGKDVYPATFDVDLDGDITESDILMVESNLGKVCNTNCVEDLNLDEKIEQSDVELISKFWNKKTFPIFYDLNRDGKIDVKDVQMVSGKIGTACQSCTTNPEPAKPVYTKEDLNMIYRAVLGREVKANEITAWSGTDASPEDIVFSIMSSDEYRNEAGDFVDGAYQFLLGRSPDADGKNFWITRGPLELWRGIKNSDEYKNKQYRKANLYYFILI